MGWAVVRRRAIQAGTARLSLSVLAKQVGANKSGLGRTRALCGGAGRQFENPSKLAATKRQRPDHNQAHETCTRRTDLPECARPGAESCTRGGAMRPRVHAVMSGRFG